MIWVKLCWVSFCFFCLKRGARQGARSVPEQKIGPCERRLHNDALLRVSHAQLLEFNHATETLLLLLLVLPPGVVVEEEEVEVPGTLSLLKVTPTESAICNANRTRATGGEAGGRSQRRAAS